MMKNFTSLTALLVCLLSCLGSVGQTTIASGDWNSTSTWSGGTIPTSGQTVTLNHVVTISSGSKTVSNVTISAASDNAYGGIIINSGASLTVSSQIYSATTSKKNIKINVGGTLTAGNVNLNSDTDGDNADSITVYQGGTWSSGQFLYTKNNGQKGGMYMNISGTLTVTGGFQFTPNTQSSLFTFNVNDNANATISGYTLFNNKSKSNIDINVTGNLTFNNGLNIFGEGDNGYTTVTIGSASKAGTITTYETVTFKKSDSNGTNKRENKLLFQNGQFIVNGEFRFEGSDNNIVDYNEISFENNSPYTGLSKKMIIKGKMFPYQRPYGKASYNNVPNGTSIGYFFSGTASPTFRPDENGNFKFQNIIVETSTGYTTQEGALSNSNMIGTLTINDGCKMWNGSSNSNANTVNSYAGQINVLGTLVNVNVDNVPYQNVSGTTTQVATYGSNSVVEFYETYANTILTGSTFSIPTVSLTGTADKYLQQSLDASARKVGRILHKTGLFRIGYQPYITTTIDFKLYNDSRLSSSSTKQLVIDSAAIVNIPQNFTNIPDFVLNSNAYGIVTYDMGYSSIHSTQKVYAPYGDLNGTVNGAYGILKISDSNRPKELLASSTFKVQNYMEVTGGATFTINTGSKVILSSTASMTAYIPAISGTIAYVGTGKIQVQKYISFGTTYNYRDFTTPITNTTLASWQNAGLFFSGFTGSSYPSYSNYTYTYTESTTGDLDQGFVAPSNITNPVITYDGNGKITRSGWRSVQGLTGGSTVTMVDEGSIFQGNVDYNLAFTTGGLSRTADDGWNFIGNPYPAVLNWSSVYSDRSGSDLVSNSTTNGIAPTIWVWNPEDQSGSSYKDGSYTYYNAATGVGETNIINIPQYQGFWVKTYHSSSSSTSFTLRLKESHKASGSKAFLKAEQSNNHLVVDLSVRDADDYVSDKISFHKWADATNELDETFDVSKVGTYYVDAVELEFMDKDAIQYLRVNAVSDKSKNIKLPIFFKAAYEGSYHLELNNLEQFIEGFACAQLRDLVTGEVIDLKQTTAYDFTSSDVVGAKRFELVFSSIDMSIKTEDVTCNGNENGKMFVKVKNVEGAFSKAYLYKDGDFYTSYPANLQVFKDTLPAGNYSLKIFEYSTCPNTVQSFTIAQPEKIVAGFEMQSATAHTGAPVVFGNTSTGAVKYEWSFGDGAVSAETNTQHQFAGAGNYTVTLKAIGADDACFESSSRQVDVSDLSAINELKSLGINVITTNGNIKLSGTAEGAEIRLFSSDGKLLYYNKYINGGEVDCSSYPTVILLSVSLNGKQYNTLISH